MFSGCSGVFLLLCRRASPLLALSVAVTAGLESLNERGTVMHVELAPCMSCVFVFWRAARMVGMPR